MEPAGAERAGASESKAESLKHTEVPISASQRFSFSAFSHETEVAPPHPLSPSGRTDSTGTALNTKQPRRVTLTNE